jgi:glycerophosphoryl diester phosphodiesterase
LVLTNHPSLAQDVILVTENFDHARQAVPEGWRVVSGDWRVSEGALVADSLDSEAYITFGEPSWQNYEVEVSVDFRQVRDPSRWLSVLVRAAPDGATPWSQVPIRFQTTKPNGMEFAVRTKSNGWSVRQAARAFSASKLHQPRKLKVVVRGSRVEGFLDEQLVVSSQFCVDRPRGCVGLGVSGCIAAFDDFSLLHLPNTADRSLTTKNRCDNVAHRGFSAAAPENTLAAIRAAVTSGASGCEFDVHACREGTIVLMHDKTVDRTTNGKGRVSELSLKELKRLDAGAWKDAQYAGESVPTLTEALQLLRGTDCQPVIEIKVEGISQQVVSDVRALDMVDEVAVIAFSQDVVREIRQLEPRIACAWLCNENLRGTASQQADWLERRARACQTRLLDVNFKMLSAELVAELKRRELGVWTWTVDEAAVMRALRQWGVDSITTNRPDLLSKQAD